jgi:sugar phosphate isomerase/epimerase
MQDYKRRNFLKTSVIAGAGAFLLPSCISESRTLTGIQLYTLRDFMNKNPQDTLEKVRAIGYREVEAAGYNSGRFYNLSPSAFKQALDDAGLRLVSGHYQTGKTSPNQQGTMVNGWEKAVEDAAAVDQKYMVLSYLHEPERKSLDDYYQVTELMNKSAEVCREYDIQFAYHNHAFEFETLDGQLPYDILLSETDENLVKMELDLFWTEKAGIDPISLFKENPGRFPLWHVKDMNENGNFTEVGTGNINFNEIFRYKGTTGMEHFFIEQDQIEGDKWESITTSYSNIQKLI